MLEKLQLCARMWTVWVLIALALDRAPGEIGHLVAPIVRVLVYVVIQFYRDLFGETPTAVIFCVFLLFFYLFQKV